MPRWRKKKERSISFDFNKLLSEYFWPLHVDRSILESKEYVLLEADELQTIQYQDIDRLTMDEGARRMNISKTVYAGIYDNAREKLASAIIDWRVLHISSPKN